MPTRSPDFRYYFANTIGFAMSDNEVRIIFGVMESPGEVESSNEQAGVVMTLKTAKILSRVLSESLAHYEATTGTVIPFDEEKAEHLKRILEGAANPASTASEPPSEQSPSDALPSS